MIRIKSKTMKDANQGNHQLMTFLLGVAAGVAITYLLSSEDKQEIFDKVRHKASHLREDMDKLIEKGKNIVNDVTKYLHDQNESHS